MPPQEPHTLVRVKLRSLLAITAGLAVVFAVASPFIRELNGQEQRYLGASVSLLIAGMILGVVISLWKLKKIERQRGELLQKVRLENRWPLFESRWFWLLILFPGMVFLTYFLCSLQMNVPASWASLFYIFFMPLFYGHYLGKEFLGHWSEGYGKEIELCERGVVIRNVFFCEWSSGYFNDIQWQANGKKLVFVIHLFHYLIAIVPEAQRDEVNAILEKYYWDREAPALQGNAKDMRRTH